ncbi:hypothetical protein JTB14_022760 [Gonioctena quinquepunctata]|nr:hypothetical protein JTB14_022760 [Gonioctena quinquepunctata]
MYVENDAEACLTALKYENLSAEEFDSYWKACVKYRLNDINIMPTSVKVLKMAFLQKIIWISPGDNVRVGFAFTMEGGRDTLPES